DRLPRHRTRLSARPRRACLGGAQGQGAAPATSRGACRAAAQAPGVELRKVVAGVKGLRYLLRNFTALAVREHLRDQVEQAGSRAELTPNEVALVRFAAEHADALSRLASSSPGASQQ